MVIIYKWVIKVPGLQVIKARMAFVGQLISEEFAVQRALMNLVHL